MGWAEVYSSAMNWRMVEFRRCDGLVGGDSICAKGTTLGRKETCSFFSRGDAPCFHAVAYWKVEGMRWKNEISTTKSRSSALIP
jgi:hypothetical protein